ncbi:hypothetical protein [Streptomyces canus]|uniref:hypothetical protein n=1 Tax=Streptomyces canus TaxID=58343 RepID=UPI00382FF41D
MEKLGPVTAHEWRTLRSLNQAYVDLRHEWEAACVHADGLMVKLEVTEGYADPDRRYRHHLAALHELHRPADAYERQASALAWRYASAAVVLGMAVMDRLIRHQPPLTPELVDEMATHEPALGTLKDACDAPYERMIAARADDHYGTEAKARENLLGLLGAAEYNLEHTDIGGRRLNPAEIDACRLSVVSPADQDPFWDNLLEPMLSLAESVPYAIARWLDRQDD